MIEPNSNPGHKPAPWEEAAPVRNPTPPPSPTQQYTQQYRAPAAAQGGLSTRTIVVIVIAVLLFVVGPIVFFAMRTVGTAERQREQVRTEELAEEQKAEAIELLNRAMNDLRAVYPETNGEFFALRDLQKQTQELFDAGKYAGEHYRVSSMSLLKDGDNPNLMNVQLECEATEQAANPRSKCTMAFNWISGKSQIAWR